jgi:flagellar biosynthesis protein FliQ
MTDAYLLAVMEAWWWAVLNGISSFVVCIAIIVSLIWRDHTLSFTPRIIIYRLTTVIIAISTLTNIVDAISDPWATNPSETLLNIGLAGWFTAYAVKQHKAC